MKAFWITLVPCLILIVSLIVSLGAKAQYHTKPQEETEDSLIVKSSETFVLDVDCEDDTLFIPDNSVFSCPVVFEGTVIFEDSVTFNGYVEYQSANSGVASEQ
jgi:hypothetical protein